MGHIMKKGLWLLLSAAFLASCGNEGPINLSGIDPDLTVPPTQVMVLGTAHLSGCLLYTSPSPRDGLLSRMPSSA